MENVVLSSPAASRRAREALARALARFPADVEEVSAASRAGALTRAATREGVRRIAVIDADAVLAPDAFGSVRRSFDSGAAIVGGRALIGSSQRLGAMFAPIRSGPDPFEFLPLHALQSNRPFADIVRGAVDIPARGAFVVAADFIASLGDVALDPEMLFLDLAVHARAAGRTIVCEPSLTFDADEDSPVVRAEAANLRRFASVGVWTPARLHRDPPRMRASYVTREVRVMGSVRGYARRPYPPCDVLVVAEDAPAQARARKSAAAIANGGALTLCAAGDGDAVRTALARTSDRYLVVCTAGTSVPHRTEFEALAERLERNGRTALALAGSIDQPRAALFHCGRIVGGARFAGASVADVVAGAVSALPAQRLFAVTAEAQIVPDPLPPLLQPRTVDVVLVAASKPTATQQTVQAIMGEPIAGTTTVVYPAGQTTMERMLTPFTTLTLAPDGDVQLAGGLNRALGATHADCVAIVRDDVQIPHGFLARLVDAFRRVPRLGAAVPRVGGNDRPESIPDLGYRNSAEMQTIADRRYELFARESLLLDYATAPVIVVSREALEIVGGFDETFGFTRCGVEDFTRRLRAANFLIARCDDAYAHLFPQAESESYVGALDAAPYLRAAFDARWRERNDFVGERDYVPLLPAAPVAAPAGATARLRILVPLRSREDWALARPLVAEFAAAFRVHDPLDVLIGLQAADFDFHAALAEVREILFATGVPMAETLNIGIDFVPDSAEWRAAGTHNAQLPGLTRDAFTGVPVVSGVESVRVLLAGLGA